MKNSDRQVTGLRSYDKRTRVAVFDVYLPGSRTERRRRTVECESYQNALSKLAAFKQELQQEVDGGGAEAAALPSPAAVVTALAVPTFDEYVNTWWDSSISANQNPQTKKRNEAALKNHIRPFFGLMLMAEAAKDITVEDFVAHLKAYRKKNKQPLSPASINTCLILIRTIFGNAMKREVIHRVPAVHRQVVPVVANELNDDEWEAFLGSFDDREAFIKRFTDPKVRNSVTPDMAEMLYQHFRASKPLFVIALATGLRRGDLLDLRWENIDLKQRLLRRTLRKTARLVKIPLSDEAIETLEECRTRPLTSSRWVFVQANGTQFSLTTLKRHFAVAKKLAGITRNFRFHDLRHSVGSRLASAGLNAFVIQGILGHTSLRMTERYSRPSAEAVREVAKALSRKSVYRVSTKSGS